jgi:hypothetical protein
MNEEAKKPAKWGPRRSARPHFWSKIMIFEKKLEEHLDFEFSQD